MQLLNAPIDPSSSTFLFEVVCQTCSADIRFSKSEALTETTNVTATILTIQCPVCNTIVPKTLNNKISEQLVTVEEYNHIPF